MLHVFTSCLTNLSREKNSGDQEPIERDEKSLEEMMRILAVFRLFDQINCPTRVPHFTTVAQFFCLVIKNIKLTFSKSSISAQIDKKNLM